MPLAFKGSMLRVQKFRDRALSGAEVQLPAAFKGSMLRVQKFRDRALSGAEVQLPAAFKVKSELITRQR